MTILEIQIDCILIVQAFEVERPYALPTTSNSMEAIILAGGLGTRLRARISDLPKSMAPILGRPFLEILMDQLLDRGCSSLILSVGHLRQVIIERFHDSYRDIPVRYAIEESPLGTGGAIRLAIRQATEDTVLVLNGDTYLDAHYPSLLQWHVQMGSAITIAVREVPDVARYGGIEVKDGYIEKFTEKGRTGSGWINAGLYALNRNFPWPSELSSVFSFENDLMVPHVKMLKPAAFLCSGQFLDIGVPEDLDRAQTDLS
jgi:D-glycero-alpha-D-manno-heptose 1-phosphate guanylyltransferase